MYNHRDLRLPNRTPHRFQLRLWLDAKCLHGELHTDGVLRYSYCGFERNRRFERLDGLWTHSNELWRAVIAKQAGGRTVREEYLVSNHAEVKCDPSPKALAARQSMPDGA